MFGWLDHDCQKLVGGIGVGSIRDRSVIKNGLRVFDDFGNHIRAFALSLELDERTLADPPIKLNEEVIISPWGLYRWPVENYTRYSDLESLEDTADETDRMTQAFAKLTNLKELGLSCDAGLGFLTGPLTRKRLPAVLKASHYEPELPLSLANPAITDKPCRYLHLKELVMKAGYRDDEVDDAIVLLLECEGKPAAWAHESGDDEADADSTCNEHTAVAQPVPEWQSTLEQNTRGARLLDGDPGSPASAARRGGGDDNPGTPSRSRQEEPAKKKSLEPAHLTVPQKEMLLELKWAHDALVQSYVISIIDSRSVFSNVTTFTIARIPGSLVQMFSRQDLWDALTSLEAFSLVVIPDWRRFTKLRQGDVDETRLNPLDACLPVFHLLNTYVGTKENIKSLHFEWICGGESGEGLAQRNRYILPAPFVAAASDMVDPLVALKGSSLLALPHVTSLSLKNCWLSPHVFLHVMNTMVDSSLSDLQLEMVSLTAPPCRQSREPVTQPAIEAHWPWPLCNGATPGRTYSLRNGGVDPAAPQVAILNVGPQTYVAFAAAIYQPPGQMQTDQFCAGGQPWSVRILWLGVSIGWRIYSQPRVCSPGLIY